jgi:nicotinate-nucleotide adenylyltransferase
MKIGLYFGTFNPIHVGHLIIANHMAENSDLEQIWLVVTPHNPKKRNFARRLSSIANGTSSD